MQCVTTEIVRVSGYRPHVDPATLLLARGGIVPLRGGPAVTPGLRVKERFRVAPVPDSPPRSRWRVTLVETSYIVFDLTDNREILAFHWHPHVLGKAFHHVHLEAGLRAAPAFIGLHVPTGGVQLEDVLTFLIDELGVQPRRADWRIVLAETHPTLTDGQASG